MNKVYKYVIDPYDSEISMPQYAEILSAGIQDGKFCFWALVDTDNALEVRNFEVVGTGWDIPTEGYNVFVGTAHDPNGFVWHAFELLNYAQAISRGVI